MVSRFKGYDGEIANILKTNPDIGSVELAKKVLKTTLSRRDSLDVTSLSKYISRNKKAILDEHEGLFEATNELDIDNSNVKHVWLKNKKVSAFVKNPNYVEPENEPAAEIDFTSIFKDKIEPVYFDSKDFNSTAVFDRLVITDIHIGMDVNKDGYALYEGVWDETELFKRLELTVQHVLKHKKSNVLYISDLGDLMDGYNAETTRGGHKLPQNMDNQKAFDVALKFKIQLIDSLIQHYDKIVSNNITNDNHGGAFSYIVNSAYKTYIELKYPDNVTVNVQRKFIDHYQIGRNIFIESHGKDCAEMKFSFKPVLDKMQENKIDNYIKENYLLQKGVDIEFAKGDSHAYVFDNTTSNSFRYCNYPAYSPPSNWVKTNFMNSRSGFVFFNYYADMQKTTHDYFF